MAEASQRTMSRQQLARHRGFERVSPEVGRLDESAFDEELAEDPDAALAMLADMSGATDPALRALARRLAGRISIETARAGSSARAGSVTMSTVPYAPESGDIDVDASLEALAEVRAGLPADVERLRMRHWRSPGTAWSLVVDRSGSMGGAPLATAAVTACAVAIRSGGDHSVIAFARDVVVVKAQDQITDIERVVDDLLALRGHGTTDLAGALEVARRQLARSGARDKVIVVLSDCRSTAGGDASAAARGALEHGCTIAVVAPAEDCNDAREFATEIGAAMAPVDGPSDVPRAITAVLERSTPRR